MKKFLVSLLLIILTITYGQTTPQKSAIQDMYYAYQEVPFKFSRQAMDEIRNRAILASILELDEGNLPQLLQLILDLNKPNYHVFDFTEESVDISKFRLALHIPEFNSENLVILDQEAFYLFQNNSISYSLRNGSNQIIGALLLKEDAVTIMFDRNYDRLAELALHFYTDELNQLHKIIIVDEFQGLEFLKSFMSNPEEVLCGNTNDTSVTENDGSANIPTQFDTENDYKKEKGSINLCSTSSYGNTTSSIGENYIDSIKNFETAFDCQTTKFDSENYLAIKPSTIAKRAKEAWDFGKKVINEAKSLLKEAWDNVDPAIRLPIGEELQNQMLEKLPEILEILDKIKDFFTQNDEGNPANSEIAESGNEVNPTNSENNKGNSVESKIEKNTKQEKNEKAPAYAPSPETGPNTTGCTPAELFEEQAKAAITYCTDPTRNPGESEDNHELAKLLGIQCNENEKILEELAKTYQLTKLHPEACITDGEEACFLKNEIEKNRFLNENGPILSCLDDPACNPSPEDLTMLKNLILNEIMSSDLNQP